MSAPIDQMLAEQNSLRPGVLGSSTGNMSMAVSINGAPFHVFAENLSENAAPNAISTYLSSLNSLVPIQNVKIQIFNTGVANAPAFILDLSSGLQKGENVTQASVTALANVGFSYDIGILASRLVSGAVTKNIVGGAAVALFNAFGAAVTGDPHWNIADAIVKFDQAMDIALATAVAITGQIPTPYPAFPLPTANPTPTPESLYHPLTGVINLFMDPTLRIRDRRGYPLQRQQSQQGGPQNSRTSYTPATPNRPSTWPGVNPTNPGFYNNDGIPHYVTSTSTRIAGYGPPYGTNNATSSAWQPPYGNSAVPPSNLWQPPQQPVERPVSPSVPPPTQLLSPGAEAGLPSPTVDTSPVDSSETAPPVFNNVFTGDGGDGDG